MKNLNSTINVPVSTLNAIKSLLFSEEQGGVDLSLIVEDLTTGNENKDLIAINVGLTFKGIKPEIDKSTRFSKDYRDLVQYTFVSYSMIKDIVTIERRIIARWDINKNDLCPYEDKQTYMETTSLNGWYSKPTNRAEPTQELVKAWFKEEKKEESAE